MAEFAEEAVEKLLPAFEYIKKSKVLSEEQLAELVRRCNRYEYRIQKRTKAATDYSSYITYLKGFLDEWKRQLLIKKRETPRDPVRRTLQKRIAWLYKIRSERFKKLEYFLDEIRFAAQANMVSSASQAYNRLTQIHGHKAPLLTDILPNTPSASKKKNKTVTDE